MCGHCASWLPPAAIVARQRAALAAIGCDKQDSVDYSQVVQPDVAALARQERRDQFELFPSELHPGSFSAVPQFVKFALTRPRASP